MSKHFTTIHTYTREQALADGVLVDATARAKDVGFRIPVALTTGAWAECVRVLRDDDRREEEARLWDVLSMLRFVIELARGDTRELAFRVCVQNESDADLVDLKAVCGPDDDGSPCLTEMLPDED